jgi:hypothetical protein
MNKIEVADVCHIDSDMVINPVKTPVECTMRMPRIIKEKWLEGLRSGQFQKGIGQLMTNEGKFCCLGVLQMVVDGQVEHFPDGDSLGLPSSDWLIKHGISFSGASVAAIVNTNPLVSAIVETESESAIRTIRVPILNDEYQCDFAHIADILEPNIEVTD